MIFFNPSRAFYNEFNLIRFWKCELWKVFSHHIFVVVQTSSCGLVKEN